MRTFDFIIAGAGPAGSYTALKLSEYGFKVGLVDKYEFPRKKLCGGCISARASILLPKGWESLILSKIKEGIIGYSGKEYISKISNEIVAYIIRRSDFDYFLVKKAIEKHAHFFESCEVRDFKEEKEHVEVITSQGTFKTKYLIGADGFFSIIAKKLGYKKNKYYRSVEAFIEGSIENRVIIELGYVKRGYLWLFPAGCGKVSVGVASTGNENLSKLLGNYIISKLDTSNFKIRGWFIPFVEREKDICLGKGRILLIGDSANMTDPLIGEGIYYSMLAGSLLAKSAKENFENLALAYRDEVKHKILREFIYAGKIANLAYRFQYVAFSMAKGSIIESYFNLLTGKSNYRSIYLRGLPFFAINFDRIIKQCLKR